MGNLSRIDLAGLVRRHDIRTVVETGTGRGDSVRAALQVPEIRAIVSIEIDEETYCQNCERFGNVQHLVLIHGNSLTALPDIAATLPAHIPVLWYLDAHFPGSARLEDPEPMTGRGRDVVPIIEELRLLRAARNLARDVIVVDDLCMFEEGAYEVDYPEFRLRLDMQVDWSALTTTHELTRVLRDSGYLIATPIQTGEERP